MNLSWMTGRCATNMVRLGGGNVESVIHGESSQTGSVRTTRTRLEYVVAQTRACKIVLIMSAGSYSRLARHGLV
jgi:hypothetical protein